MTDSQIKCTFAAPGQLCGKIIVGSAKLCSLSAGECPYQGFKQPLPTKCTWSNSEGAEEDDSDTHWVTSCNEDFILNDGTPEGNNMKYCCFCGKFIDQLVEQ